MADSQQLRERTLVVLKPDAVVRGLAGRIIQRFEDASLKIIGVKMREMDADFARKHYFDLEERTSPEVYQATATFMQRGPVIAFVLEGDDAVATVRKIVGTTYPNEASPARSAATSPTSPRRSPPRPARPSPTWCTPRATGKKRSTR